jgi:hypothetical protein
MRTYTAKGPHKRPCDLCGESILIGDSVVSWPFVSEDGPSGSDIMRVHKTCYAIADAACIEEFTKGHAFEERSDVPIAGTWLATMRKYEASQDLAAARVKWLRAELCRHEATEASLRNRLRELTGRDR